MDSSSISSDLIRGHIDTIILKTLIDSDKCANDITKDIEDKSEGKYILKQATLYSALKRLETLKMVSPYWSDSPDGGRRRYFKLTESGEKLVKNNLKEWNNSKNILDLLITDKKEVQPTIIAPTPILVQPKPIIQPVEPVKTVVLPEKQVVNEKTTENSYKESTDNFNFRNVLNDIVKSSNIVEGTVYEEPKPKISIAPVIEKVEETPTTPQIEISFDKVDYSDIVEKSLKEGFTVKFSNKAQKSTGGFFVNKIKILSALIMFFVMLGEIFIVSYLYDFITPGKALISALLPVVFLTGIFIVSYKNILKRANQNFAMNMWTALIIAINLALLTLAANLLLDVDLYNVQNVVYYLLLPGILYFDIFAYYFVKLILSKAKSLQFDKKSKK
ncbi:MAG: PadR family transcriptional regulator [Clostridia bacterium]|nr:PadR family transcriptional regulator [Clostridia bacterium]